MGRRSDPSGRAVCAFSLAVVVSLVSAAGAMGQAAIDQYVPSAKPGSHHGSPAEAIRELFATSAPGEPPAGPKAKKKAPVTVRSSRPGGAPDTDGGGYPLTAFVIVVLLLFLLGLAARYARDLIRRLRPRQAL